MEFKNYIDMDPNILLGIANDKLRHECKDLQGLSSMMEVDQHQIESRLAEIGFHYEAKLNQFKPDLS